MSTLTPVGRTGSAGDERPLPVRRRRRQPHKQAYLLVAPCLLIIAVLVLYPLLVSLFDSVHVDNAVVASHAFVGSRNYTTVFSDPDFQRSAKNSAVYLAFTTFGCLLAGLGIAVWLHHVRRVRSFFLVIVILPWAVPGTVTGILWSFIYSPVGGLLNAVLQRLHLLHHDVLWLQGSWSGLAFVSLSLIWQTTPIVAVIFLAGLESIPQDLYEQAEIDGASGLKRFWTITLPLLRPSLAIGMLEASVIAISLFDQAYVLTGYAPGTTSVIQQIYLYAFREFNFGVGIAGSVIVTAATLLVSVAYLKGLYREVTY